MVVCFAREAQFAHTNSCPLPPTHISDTNSCLVTLLDIVGLFLIALFSVFCVCCVQVYFNFSTYTFLCMSQVMSHSSYMHDVFECPVVAQCLVIRCKR